MFEQELIMFEQMPELALMNILCYKAIFDPLNYLVGKRDVQT